MARWRAAKEAETGKNERRPYLASECKDVKKCEKWRLEIIREISKKVAQIQNAGLGEFRIRDLNDEINKLLREKRHWENQISVTNLLKNFSMKFEIYIFNRFRIWVVRIIGVMAPRCLMRRDVKYPVIEDINILGLRRICQEFGSFSNRNLRPRQGKVELS